MIDTFEFRLGDFLFRRTEVPDELPWGAEQKAGVHPMVGGKKVVDAMGGFDLPISWRGEFTGADATTRARQLVAMTKAGKAQVLSAGELQFEVLVLRFEPRKLGQLRVPYDITVEVLRDLATPDPPKPDPGVDALVNADLQACEALGVEIGDAELSDLLAGASKRALTLRDFSPSNQLGIDQLLAPIEAAGARVRNLIGDASAILLGGSTPLGNVAINVAAPVLAQRLLQQLGAADDLVPLYDLDAHLTRMEINLDAIGESGLIVLPGGEDLFDLSARAYGDIAGWSTIARANNLTDPQVDGLTELRIPPTMDDNGGVLA